MSGQYYSETLGTLVSVETNLPVTFDEIYGTSEYIPNHIEQSDLDNQKVTNPSMARKLFYVSVISGIIAIWTYLLL